MATKKELLKNLRSFTPEEIASAVREGTVSLYELGKETEGAFTPLLKKRVKEILDKTEIAPNEGIAHSAETETISESPLDGEADIISTDTIDSAASSDIVENPVAFANEPAKTSTVVEDEVIDNRGMFKRPFNFFTGRIRRMEYWLSIVILYAYSFVIGLIVGAANGPNSVMYLLLIPGYIFIWAQGSKRCHDRGNSGWYQLIPFYGLWMAFADSEPGDNEYGNNPKE